METEELKRRWEKAVKVAANASQSAAALKQAYVESLARDRGLVIGQEVEFIGRKREPQKGVLVGVYLWWVDDIRWRVRPILKDGRRGVERTVYDWDQITGRPDKGSSTPEVPPRRTVT